MFIRALGFWGSTLGKKEVNWTELQALFPALTRAIPGLSVLYIGAYVRSYLEKTKQNKKHVLLLKETDKKRPRV